MAHVKIGMHRGALLTLHDKLRLVRKTSTGIFPRFLATPFSKKTIENEGDKSRSCCIARSSLSTAKQMLRGQMVDPRLTLWSSVKNVPWQTGESGCLQSL